MVGAVVYDILLCAPLSAGVEIYTFVCDAHGVLNIADEVELIMIDTLGLVVIAFFLAIFINQSFPIFSSS